MLKADCALQPAYKQTLTSSPEWHKHLSCRRSLRCSRTPSHGVPRLLLLGTHMIDSEADYWAGPCTGSWSKVRLDVALIPCQQTKQNNPDVESGGSQLCCAGAP